MGADDAGEVSYGVGGWIIGISTDVHLVYVPRLNFCQGFEFHDVVHTLWL